MLGSKVKNLEYIQNPTEKSQEDLEKEIEELENQEKDLRKRETQIEDKIIDYHKINDTGICPTCDRPANLGEFVEKLKSKTLDKDEISQKVNECSDTIKNTKQIFKQKDQYNNAQEQLNDYQKHLDEYLKEIQKRRQKIGEAQIEVEKSNLQLEASKENSNHLNEVSKKLEELDQEVVTVEDKLIRIRDDMSQADTWKKRSQEEADEHKKQIRKKEQDKLRSRMLNEYQIWIEDYFIPTIDSIERHVMTNINQEFDSQFQKWFGMLVEDVEKEARVDDDFTPLVEQDGHEQEINYLSGGEKTSVALAYRLALNNIVQKISTGMKSNLLILDEPTDGFSKEQLGKVREILDEIESPQVIIVSHEKELESFADQIFRVTKSQGESEIA